MSYDGIWTVQMADRSGWRNIGILAMEGGRAIAGNDNYYARGSYAVSEGLVHMTLAVWFYGTSGTLASASGQAFTIEFQGNATPQLISGTLSRPDKAKFRIRTRLTRRVDLPASPPGPRPGAGDWESPAAAVA
jgi:hypothetical protein